MVIWGGQKKRDDARSRLYDRLPVAVIDIGSNSVRLVAYEGARRSPTPLFNEKVLCGLGRGVAASGRLEKAAADSALETLRRFRVIMEQAGIGELHVLATSAIREAENGDEFCRKAAEICDARITLLSGKEEAEYAARGVISGVHHADGLSGDLGGGSLELVDIRGDRFDRSTTLPLGGLTLVQNSGGDLAKAASLIDASLDQLDWLQIGKGRTFHAVGGTWRAIARLAMEAAHYPLRVMHGYRLPHKDLLDFLLLLGRSKKLSSIPGMSSIAGPRREVVPFGALVLRKLVERIEPKEVMFSVFGIREGLLYSLMSEAERAEDPLLRFSEDLALLRSRSLAHARELCTWTDPIFDHAGTRESADERRLRHAACLLSDIGWREHPDYRGEYCLAAIAHATLSAVDHTDRIFIALALYFRHDRSLSDPYGLRLAGHVDRQSMRRARLLGAAIRAAHMLSIGMPGLIPHAPVTIEGKQFVLTLPRRYEAFNGDRLRRRFGALANELGCELEIRIT